MLFPQGRPVFGGMTCDAVRGMDLSAETDFAARCLIYFSKQMRGLVALTVAAAFELAAAVMSPAGGLVVPGSSHVLARPGRMDSALRLRGGGKDKMHWYGDP